MKHKKILTKDLFVGTVGLITFLLILIIYIGFNSRMINVILAILISFLMLVTMYLFILELKKACTLKDNKIKNIIIITLCILFMLILKETDYWIARKADLLSINDYLLNDYSKLLGNGAFSNFLVTQIFVFSWIPEGLIFITIFILISLCLHINKQYKAINYLNSAYSIFTFIYIIRMLLRKDAIYTNDLDFEGFNSITNYFIYSDKQIFHAFSLTSISFTLILILTGYIFINLLSKNVQKETEVSEVVDCNEMLEDNKFNNFIFSWDIIYIFVIVLWCINKITYIDNIFKNLYLTDFYSIIIFSSGSTNILSLICFVISTILLIGRIYNHYRYNSKLFKSKQYVIFVVAYVIHVVFIGLTAFGVI